MTRYDSSCLVRESLEEGKRQEAVGDTYFPLEKELIDRIILALPSPELQMEECRRRQELKEKNGNSPTLKKLISDAYKQNAISKSEKVVFENFRELRNSMVHRPGYWHPDAGNHGQITHVVLETLDLPGFRSSE